jgi:hypothetical protein
MITAAETLRGILSTLPATGGEQDDRIRQALLEAASALEHEQDPTKAITAAYSRRAGGK